ncbi:MAG TPA: SDR family NAD(P)-dependent oxidoreductase [Chloroflexota bacterium]
MRALITGGAGFVGANLASYLAERDHQVVVFDNLQRRGSQANVAWLRERHGSRVTVMEGDVRDAEAVRRAMRRADIVYHLAAQVAVTTSVERPVDDFEINARGTLNVLEAARAEGSRVVFTSTNKVYGAMEDVRVVELDRRYDYVNLPQGVDEERPLDFHSPYGCSKGAADQYVRDYARIYGVPTMVFRMSCIYGVRQFGTEDQGWVAHFIISAARGRPLTIYGDGKQVRDILYIEDLLRVFERAAERIDTLPGRIYNIGGGRSNAISLLDLIAWLGELRGEPVPYRFGPWRPGDQRVYYSDIGRARTELGWEPRVSAREGVERLYRWVMSNLPIFE